MGTKDKNNLKYFFKHYWIPVLCALIAITIFVGNVLVLCLLDEKDQSAWLTLYSGWVSGVATFLIGLIAAIQSRNYKHENDTFELQQLQKEWRLEQKEGIKFYYGSLVKIYEELQQNQYNKVVNECYEKLCRDHNTLIEIVLTQTLWDINNRFKYEAINTIYYFDGIEDVVLMCENYITNLTSHLDKIEWHIENGDSEFLNELYLEYEELMKKFNEFISHVRLFICCTMTNNKPEEIEKMLNDMAQKQNDWRNRINQEQNK